MDHTYRRDHEMAYVADKSMSRQTMQTKRAIREYNEAMPFDQERGRACLDRAGIRHGTQVYIEPPFYCEYGGHITLGEGFYANTGCVMLDVGAISIGDQVMFGPNVSLYTAGHPVHPESRNSGYEYGIPIVIGDSVWIGGSCCVLPGVTIGSHTVIGAGSVVTRDIPDHVIAAGNPCRVIRSITEEDRQFYFKDRRFDQEAWEEICGKQESGRQPAGDPGQSGETKGE